MNFNSNRFTQNTIINNDSPLTEAAMRGQILMVCSQSQEIEKRQSRRHVGWRRRRHTKTKNIAQGEEGMGASDPGWQGETSKNTTA